MEDRPNAEPNREECGRVPSREGSTATTALRVCDHQTNSIRPTREPSSSAGTTVSLIPHRPVLKKLPAALP